MGAVHRTTDFPDVHILTVMVHGCLHEFSPPVTKRGSVHTPPLGEINRSACERGRLAAFRRIRQGRPALFTRFSDLAALGALAVILISGFLLEGAKIVREDFLHQNAFEPVDTYSSLKKQFRLLDVILQYYRLARESLDRGTSLEKLLALPVKERIARAKLIPEESLSEFDKILGELKAQIEGAK